MPEPGRLPRINRSNNELPNQVLNAVRNARRLIFRADHLNVLSFTVQAAR
jgi:hypothetical protein